MTANRSPNEVERDQIRAIFEPPPPKIELPPAFMKAVVAGGGVLFVLAVLA